MKSTASEPGLTLILKVIVFGTWKFVRSLVKGGTHGTESRKGPQEKAVRPTS